MTKQGFQAQKNRLDGRLMFLANNVVPVGGLEPPRPKATDFEKNASVKTVIFQAIIKQIQTFAN